MEHLIIYAHPNPKSFNHAILTAVEERLGRLKKNCVTRDLYGLNFDPVLKNTDFIALQQGKLPLDIAKEQDYIKRAKTIIIIHPIWWFNAPAILKGYIDRVFSYGFAYAVKEGKLAGLLPDKRIFVFNTTGGGEATYNQAGFAQALKTTIDTGTYGLCGMKVEQHIFFYEVPTVTHEKREAMLAQIKTMNF